MSWISTNNLRRFADKLFHGNLSFGGSVTHNGATTFNGGVKVNTTKAEFAAPVSFTGTTTYKGNEIATKADVSAVGSNITVDGVLSATSTNPVQNKVIKTELDKKESKTDAQIEYKRLHDAILNAGYTSPTEYRRAELPVSGRTTITISKTRVVINGHLLETTGNALILYQSMYWDNKTYVTAANRAGKDFYIYACIPDSGTEPKFILSANSTVPTGYTADNSRKIGGFHCLCANVGIISGHSLSGYITGDILPASVWDLLHRCKGENEGMVYDAYDDVWIGIYLLSYDNGRAVSRYNGVILDGESTPKTHGLWFTETLAKQKMRLPYLHEFFTALKGCQEQVNISGSKDWNTTGGHVYTNNVRCISNIGLEDPTGFMWQWSNNYGMAGGSGWGQSSYDANVDSVNRGGTYGNIWLPLAGGGRADGSNCGSRSVNGNGVAAHRYASNGARPASEPRVVIL